MGYKRAGARMAKAMHLLDNAIVTITTLVKDKDSDSAFDDKTKLKTIVADYSAKVVKGGLSSKNQREFLPDQYDAILIIDNGIEIPAGCSIIANIGGVVTHYKRATRGYTGYLSHQEVAMVLDEKA